MVEKGGSLAAATSRVHRGAPLSGGPEVSWGCRVLPAGGLGVSPQLSNKTPLLLLWGEGVEGAPACQAHANSLYLVQDLYMSVDQASATTPPPQNAVSEARQQSAEQDLLLPSFFISAAAIILAIQDPI